MGVSMRLPGKRGVSLRENGAVEASAWRPFMWRVLAVLVIGTLLAKWTWVLFAPRSAQVLPAMLPSTGFQAEHLFGSAAVSAVTVQAALPNVRLVGVFAGTPGFAVLELDGKRQLGLATGHEIVAGAKLVEVAIDYVVIERGGVRQQIQLEGKTSAIKSAATTVQAIPLPGVVPVAVAVSAPVAISASSANATAESSAELAEQIQERKTRGRGGL